MGRWANAVYLIGAGIMSIIQ